MTQLVKEREVKNEEVILSTIILSYNMNKQKNSA